MSAKSTGQASAPFEPLGLTDGTLPTEDRKVFSALLADLINELKPEGPSEHECVEDIARLRWRRNHLSIFRTAAHERQKNAKYLKEPTLLAATVALAKDSRAVTVQILEQRLGIVAQTEDVDVRAAAVLESLEKKAVANSTSSDDLQQQGTVPGFGGSGMSAIDVYKVMQKVKQESMSVLKEAFGEGLYNKLMKDVSDAMENGDGLDLAWLGDQVTVSTYREELKLKRQIDDYIEMKLKMLFRLQDANRRRRNDRNTRLMPPYK